MKRMTALIAAVLITAALSSCTYRDEGSPLPSNTSASEWTTGSSSSEDLQIKKADAISVSNELSGVLKGMFYTTYESDITYLRTVSDYLGQYKNYDTDIAKYMKSVQDLCESLHNLYAQNVTMDDIKKTIGNYENSYDSLSSDLKISTDRFDEQMLETVAKNIEALSKEAQKKSTKSGAS